MFDVVYATDLGLGEKADIEPLLIILPPLGLCFFIKE